MVIKVNFFQTVIDTLIPTEAFIALRFTVYYSHPKFSFHFAYSNTKPTNINPYRTAFPYGNGMVLHFYQQQESSTTKTVHKVINKGLKAYVWSPHTGENFH